MNYKTILATLGVLRQLNGITGLPIKFAYACVENIRIMEIVEENLQKMQDTNKVEGQGEMDAAKLKVLQAHAKRDETGNAITKTNQFGQIEYDIEDWQAFSVAMEAFKKDFESTLNDMDLRQTVINELMDEECDIDLYTVEAKHIPKDSEGNSRLSPLQLRSIMPLLEGELE